MKAHANRRGQELALSTIIIAVLVLLILLVLGIILTRQTGKFSTGVNSCQGQGGTCEEGVRYTSCSIKAPQYACKGDPAPTSTAPRTSGCCLDGP